MNFSGIWPLQPNAIARCEQLNECLDVLGSRVGADLSSLYAQPNERTADAIARIRQAVNGYLTTAFCAPDTGYPWKAIGEAEVLTGPYASRRRNIFALAFGAPWLAWRNSRTAASLGALAWGGLPFAMIVNDLHDVIDLLGWIRLDPGAVAGYAQKLYTGDWGGFASKAAATADMWSWGRWLGAAATGGGTPGPVWSRYEGFPYQNPSSFGDPPYTYSWPAVQADRCFWPVVVPADVVAMRAILYGAQDNYYGRERPDGSYLDAVAPPSWPAALRIGTTNPSPYTADDWDFGAAAASWNVTELAIAGADFVAPLAADLAGWTEDATHYLQLRADDAAAPDYMEDGNWWATGNNQYGFHKKIGGQWLRLLYRL